MTIRIAEDTDLPSILELYAQPDMDAGKVLPQSEAKRILDRMRMYPDYTDTAFCWRCD